MDNYNHLMQSEYENIVYPTQDLSTMEGILPPTDPTTTAKSIEEIDRNSIIATTTEHIIDEYGAPSSVLVPVTLSSDDLSADLQPLQSSELQPLDSVLVTPLSTQLNAVDGIDGTGIIETTSFVDAIEGIDEATAAIAEIVQAPDIGADPAKQDDVTGEEKADDEQTDDVKAEQEVGDAEDEEGAEGEDDKAAIDEPPELVEGAAPKTEDEEEEIVKREVQKEEEIDKNQCRICLSKENLVNIFKFDHGRNLRVCDIIMMLCSPLKISERDYLPHFVCALCVDKLNSTHDLKQLAEATDKELRSKLKRSKKKSRGNTEFVIIDCAEFSSGSDDDQKNDDDEFVLSEVEEAESDDDYESEESVVAKPRRRGRQPRKSRAKQSPKIQQSNKRRGSNVRGSGNKRARNDIVYIEAPADSDDDDNSPRRRSRGPGRPSKEKRKPGPRRRQNNDSDESDDNISLANRKRPDLKCTFCSKVCKSQDDLREHRKTHVGEKPFSCPICKKPFKQQASLTAHIEKHKEDDENTCMQCNKHFSSKNDLRKHAQTAHPDTYTCEKCRRTFTTRARLDKHKDGKCPGDQTPVKKKHDYDYSGTGRDLFKSVAPLTTTYWSDSFSD